MYFIVKVALGRKRRTREIDRDAPVQIMTRAGVLGFYESHPDILRQIEGADEAFFEARWEEDKLDIGRRIDDQDW